MTALNLSAILANTPSTSGTYVFSVTRDLVIRMAMLTNGALGEGENPTAAEISDCANVLNMLVKQWMGNTDFAPGLKVWTRKRAVLFLSQTQYTYQVGQTSPDNWVESTTGLSFPNLYGQTTLTAPVAGGGTVLPVSSVAQFNIGDYVGILVNGNIFWTTVSAIGANSITIPGSGLSAAALANAYVWNYTNKAVRPLSLIACVLRDINTNDVPIRFMTVERYESLPTKAMPTNLGDPTAILYESRFKTQQPNGRIFLDVGGAQDVTKRLWVTYLAPVEDLNNPGDAVDYPQQWYLPLMLKLSQLTCGMFEVTWSRENETALNDALAIARQADPSTTDAFFEVDGDGTYG